MLCCSRRDIELGLPLVFSGSLAEIPEPARTQYEEKYVAAIRLVGSKFLETGDIPTAWAYFRAIGENEPVERAILDYRPPENDERLGAIIEVAFNHGVSPRRGFRADPGTLRHLPGDLGLRAIAAARGDCASGLRHSLDPPPASRALGQSSRRDRQPRPGPAAGRKSRSRSTCGSALGSSPTSRTTSTSRTWRPWCGCRSIVVDPDVIALAADLTEYGRRLSPRLQFEGPPPFQQIFDDHGIYLRRPPGPGRRPRDRSLPGEIARGRRSAGPRIHCRPRPWSTCWFASGELDAAIDVAAEHLADLPDSSLTCPSVAQLCQRAGEPERLARIARDHGDLVNFAAARLERIT